MFHRLAFLYANPDMPPTFFERTLHRMNCPDCSPDCAEARRRFGVTS